MVSSHQNYTIPWRPHVRADGQAAVLGLIPPGHVPIGYFDDRIARENPDIP
jgi:hypothetical protein